jgi:hypothetical protein
MEIFIIDDGEANRLLGHVEKWVRLLKTLNVPPDIAVSVAQVFLAPQTGQADQQADCTQTTHAVGGDAYQPDEGSNCD